MVSTGIVRRIDDLGRIVIPKDVRNKLNIQEGEQLELFLDSNGTMSFRKYEPEPKDERMKFYIILSKCDGLVDISYFHNRENAIAEFENIKDNLRYDYSEDELKDCGDCIAVFKKPECDWFQLLEVDDRDFED